MKPPGLPLGIRDYLPAGAALRRRIANACLGTFERWGYRRVITPMFEYADVLARGSSGRESSSLRFVEPGSGDVLALRSDITPQIARLCATRYGAEVGPVRLCYEGSVIRLGRAQREVIQVGVELVTPIPMGDAAGSRGGDREVIALCDAALRATGLPAPRFDVGHPRFASACLDLLPDELRDGVRQALLHKDTDAITRALAKTTLPARVRRLLQALPELYGDEAVLAEARRLLGTTGLSAARAALAETEAVAVDLAEAGVAEYGFDLGEVRGFEYYTGVRFQAFVEGYGDAVARGGRYDALCGQYGRTAAATGFAVEVEGVAAGLRAVFGRAGEAAAGAGGVLVAGPANLADQQVRKLHAEGERAARWLGRTVSDAELRAYADRWGYARILVVGNRRKKAEG